MYLVVFCFTWRIPALAKENPDFMDELFQLKKTSTMALETDGFLWFPVFISLS